VRRRIRVVGVRPLEANWVPCEDCDDVWCLTHQQHVYDCDCLPIEDWPESPYKQDA
jgi:hypothetical protein